MKYLLVLMLVLGTAFAATLMNFDIDTENTCDGTDEITVVTVTDSADDDPVEDAYVKVEDISPWKQKTSGLADSDGEFEFEGCGDTWNVSASYGGYATKTITITLGACDSCTGSPSTPPVQNPANTTNTTSAPSTPPPTTPSTSNDSNSTTTTSGSTTTGSTTTSTPPSYPADTSDSDTANETEDEGTTSAKKPLPCCTTSAIIVGLVGLLAVKARR